MTPVALESAANQAYGKALHDVARAAQRYRDLWLEAWRVEPDTHSLDAALLAGWTDISRALDHLTALGWVPGPERVGAALAGSGEAGKP